MPSPQMQEVISRFRQRRLASVGQTPPPLEQIRANFAPAGRLHPMPDDVQVAQESADGVPAYWLSTPGADPGRVLLFVHGGGYSLGSLRSYGELAARLGRAARMRVLFPEYRLAPEHPYPAAIHDVQAVWRWLREEQGQAAQSIALCGDSAGGALIISLLTTLRDAGEQLPPAAAAMSPLTDLILSGTSISERVDDDPIFTHEMLRGLAAGYLVGADPRSPLASPLFAELKGLPPLLVLVGTAELLLSDSERLVSAGTDAGVEVILQIGEGLPHVYPLMLGTPEAAAATDQIGTFLSARVC